MIRHFTSLTRRFALLACLLALVPTVALAQSPTGTITGHVVDQTGAAVRGATVTITSPNLQGRRTTLSSENGDYIFTILQPGAYTLSVEAQGFERFSRAVAVAPAERVAVNPALSAARVTEAVSVSADAPSFVGTVQAAASLKYNTINLLPTNRDLLSYVALSPGVHSTGPDGNISIQGAMSFENLFLINGAVVQDNVRSEPMTLFIEDALQEVTTATSGISAEYGRFSGGVVTAVTKSGGNLFSGSYRTSFANDNWRTVSPFGEPKTDKLIPTYEFTVGGPIVRDRLWFFGAGRSVKETTAQQTAITQVPYVREFNEQRYEINSTVGLGAGRRLKVDYLGLNQSGKNSATASIGDDAMDLRSLIARKDPMSLVTVNYAGAISRNVTLEAQYSTRRWTIKDAGGTNPDRIEGTPVFDQSTGFSYWAPGFCGICDEKRSNENVFVKGTSFLSTRNGSHDVRFGYDTFNDVLDGDNRQSASDYWLYASSAIQDGATLYPVIDEGTFIVHWPLLESSKGTNFRTHALYANDTWAINSHLTANLGVRYDLNRGKNSAGLLISDDKVFSPRLGLTWDPKGEGRTIFTASFGRYVSALANTVANESSGAGLPAILVYQYFGAPINVDPNLPLVSTPDVLKQAFAWYDANVATEVPVQATVPGVETQIRGSLKSPHSDEIAFGVSQQIGRRGSVRVDFVNRRFRDFYSERNDTSTGKVSDEFGQEFDLTLVENTNLLKRQYNGLTMQAGYRPTSRIDLGAAYTLSELKGNFDGEDFGSGPLAARIAAYPEYSDPAWSFPEGDLSSDQRHRLRVWSNIDLPAGEKNMLSLGVIQRSESGTPYGAVADVSLFDADFNDYVANPGYLNPPSTSTYFFGPRDQFRTAWLYRTDLSVNYSRKLSGGGGPQAFVQFQFLNLFNQFQAFNNARSEISTTTLTAVNGNYEPFNPFSETPVQGVNWDYGSKFGTPVSKNAYTTPRTFRFSAGFRF